MPDTTLRQTERDLFAAVKELREDDIPAAEQDIEEIKAKAAEHESIPADLERRYQRAKQQLRELHGTAETYEHYAERWGDGDTCVFVLEELNGDEYAAVTDAVRAEAGVKAQQSGTVPEGFGRIKALEFGVEDLPEECPPDPGAWPAPIVNELFAELEELTAPSGVDLGNESLESALNREAETELESGTTGAATPGVSSAPE